MRGGSTKLSGGVSKELKDAGCGEEIWALNEDENAGGSGGEHVGESGYVQTTRSDWKWKSYHETVYQLWAIIRDPRKHSDAWKAAVRL